MSFFDLIALLAVASLMSSFVLTQVPFRAPRDIYPHCHREKQFVGNCPPLLNKGYAEYKNAQGCSLEARLGICQTCRRKPAEFPELRGHSPERQVLKL